MRAVAILAAGLLLGRAAAAAGQTRSGPTDSTRVLVLVGIGAGVLDVDLPDPNHPGAIFGPSFRLSFDLGYEFSDWLGVQAGVGFTMLGGSDSLDAVLRGMGREDESAFTLVDFGAGVRVRWPLASGRWAPFVRAGAGGATFSLAAPGFGRRDTGPTWSAGGGVEILPVRPVVVRVAASWLGHRYQDVTRNHVGVELVVLYAFFGSRLLG